MNLPPQARNPSAGRAETRAPGRVARPREFSILYVEHAAAVADAVRETLEASGWRVEVCARGDEALGRLQGGASYDLLILDFALPGLDGVELARHARRLPRAAATPIIMFTACEVEREARRAGVDEYLRKPRGVYSIAGTAARLLARRAGQE
ncbi:MAG TPA: response regulator [Pyrinomonadaceae bacterium]|jgi:CheY-like chemotaxis protein